MFLAIDVGNSNIKFGVHTGTDWIGLWRAATIPNKMGDEYAVLLANFLHENALTLSDLTAVAMASVVPPLTPALVEMCTEHLGLTPLILGPGTRTGLRMHLDSPRAVGADRVANVVAARALFGGPAIVLDCGTATKWEALSADGEFLGGAIAPGIGLGPDALATRTAHLGKVALEPPPSPIGQNTIHAQQSGLFWGALGMIEGLIRRIQSELAPADPGSVSVLATGGLSPLFAGHTALIDALIPNLTLEGLRVIWELNQG